MTAEGRQNSSLRTRALLEAVDALLRLVEYPDTAVDMQIKQLRAAVVNTNNLIGHLDQTYEALER